MYDTITFASTPNCVSVKFHTKYERIFSNQMIVVYFVAIGVLEVFATGFMFAPMHGCGPHCTMKPEGYSYRLYCEVSDNFKEFALATKFCPGIRHVGLGEFNSFRLGCRTGGDLCLYVLDRQAHENEQEDGQTSE